MTRQTPPPRLRRPWPSLVALLTATVAVAAACDSSDDTTDTEPPPPPALRVAAVTPVGGARVERDSNACISLGADADGTLILDVRAPATDELPNPPAGSIANFVLRPRGACGSIEPCGSLVVRVDPDSGDELRTESPVAAAAVPLAKLKAPTGAHTLRVELQDDLGNAVLDATGAPVFDEITIDIRAQGACSGDAGTDAGMDAGSDASGDASTDADSDAGSDADVDAPADAPVDGAFDAGDSGADAGTDADGGTDAATD